MSGYLYKVTMNPENFNSNLNGLQQQLKGYVYNIFPNRAGNISLRFINGNFRAQGWQGTTFQRWKKNRRKGTILIKTGSLRRGNYFTTAPGQAHVRNDVKYAALHNRGFNGTVQVKAHRRRILAAQKVESGRLTKTGKMKMKTVHTVKGVSEVKAHSRKMNIPKRQFFPESTNDSPVLAGAIRREIQRSLQNIFK